MCLLCAPTQQNYLIELWIPLTSAGNQPSDEEVKKLVDESEKYTLANHLFWGLWGVISVCLLHTSSLYHYISPCIFLFLCYNCCFFWQAYVNNIEFDYMEYARGRFKQYWLRKPELLGASDDLLHVDDSAEPVHILRSKDLC